jgi:hypothetical protein
MRKEALNRVKSTGARKFSRRVNGIRHNDDSRKPASDIFKALARAISYKGGDEIGGSSLALQWHHTDAPLPITTVFGPPTTELDRTNDSSSIFSVLRATTAGAQERCPKMAMQQTRCEQFH